MLESDNGISASSIEEQVTGFFQFSFGFIVARKFHSESEISASGCWATHFKSATAGIISSGTDVFEIPRFDNANMDKVKQI